MRMVVTVLTAFALTALLSFTWYITQPILVSINNISQDVTELGGWNTTGSGQTYTLLTLGANVGFALAILFVWVWVFISAQASDYSGYVQGGY